MTKLLKNTLFENIKDLSENFSKHYHDTYTIGITYNGVIKTYNSNRSFDFYKYSIRVNNPNEVHSGVSQDWSHSNFYPTKAASRLPAWHNYKRRQKNTAV